MFNRSLIIFFYVYLISRFFTETLGILPKAFDLIDLPVVTLFGILLIMPTSNSEYTITEKFVPRATIAFILIVLMSVLINIDNIFYPSAILFVIGNLGGPILYLSIEKFSKDKFSLAQKIEKLFLVLLVINIVIVIFINLPTFIITRNPDVISGTYGKNAYQFSILLIITGTYFLGRFYVLKKSIFYILITQFFIFAIFYLMQYRAALPFFVLSYIIVISLLYKIKLAKIFIPFIVILVISILIANIVVERADTDLGYNIWTIVLSDPTKFLKYGKAISYGQTFKMLFENPEYIPFGCGPGNFLSRAFYTFGWDFVASFQKDKGVGAIIAQVFNMKSPRFPFLYLKYLSLQVNTGNFMGTGQFSNPHSSLLASISETGVMGLFVVSSYYILIIVKSIKYLRLSEKFNTNMIPLNISLVASSIYLFLLGFLDCYYEVLRMTLPVWLLFWVNSFYYHKTKEDLDSNNIEY